MKKENLTLLIMAAGMGSRFGGLKQIEPFGPNGEFLTDYSIYDAKQAGVTKVVFIIKKENLQDFKDTIGKRIEPFIDVEYVFQKMDFIPDGVIMPKERKKPWGTAHAIYCAKDVVRENFIVINADDFYGRDGYFQIAEFLRNIKKDKNKEKFGMVGYYVKNTLTEHGSVKRGVCRIQGEYLDSLIESNIERLENGKIVASPLDKSSSFEISENEMVAMNLFGFTPEIFSYIEEKMVEFFEHHQDSLETCEFLIPDVLTDMIHENRADVLVIPTTSKWMGVTYKEDKDYVVNSLRKLIDEGVYNEELWKK